MFMFPMSIILHNKKVVFNLVSCDAYDEEN